MLKRKTPKLEPCERIDQIFATTSEVEGVAKNEVRASSLPFCARKYVIHRTCDLEPLAVGTFVRDCFLELGTALHTVAQRYLSLGGVLWGYWLCDKCEARKGPEIGPLYCCDQLMVYEELAFSHPCGLTGHADGIWLEQKALLEIKGCYPGKLERMAANDEPVVEHWLYQANFYLHEANKLPDIPVQLDKIILIYIDRGLPLNTQRYPHRKYFVRKPNTKVYENTIKQIEGAKKALHLRVMPDRICATEGDGRDMNCMWRHVCFLPGRKLEDACRCE